MYDVGTQPLSLNAPMWRFELLNRIVEHHGTMPRSQADVSLRAGYRYFKRYREDTSPERHFRLLQEWPTLYRAHALHLDHTSERWQIEAGLVANATAEEIAQYVAQDPAVVNTYETYFYDIRGKLKSEGYILNRIFLPAVKHGLDGRDYDFMMKSISYFFGWEQAKQFVSGRPLTPEARRWTHQGFEDDMLKTGWMALKRIDLNNFTAPKMVELCLKLKEIEVQKGTGAAQEEALKTFGMLLESCATTVMPTYDHETNPDESLLLTDEPRVAQLMGGPAAKGFDRPAPQAVKS